jgi:hypothetical protein
MSLLYKGDFSNGFFQTSNTYQQFFRFMGNGHFKITVSGLPGMIYEKTLPFKRYFCRYWNINNTHFVYTIIPADVFVRFFKSLYFNFIFSFRFICFYQSDNSPNWSYNYKYNTDYYKYDTEYISLIIGRYKLFFRHSRFFIVWYWLIIGCCKIIIRRYRHKPQAAPSSQSYSRYQKYNENNDTLDFVFFSQFNFRFG